MQESNVVDYMAYIVIVTHPSQNNLYINVIPARKNEVEVTVFVPELTHCTEATG